MNEDHISFNARNADWAGTEIRDATNPKYDCSVLCSGIVGPDSFCGSASYQVSLGINSSVAWSASGAISISGPTTGSTVTVVPNGPGTGTLTATVNTPCGNSTLSKSINAGLPPGAGSTSPSVNPLCPGQIKYVSVQQNPGIDSYLWYTNSSGIDVYGSGTSGTIEGNTPGTHQFTIRTTNSCGYTEQTYFVNVLNYGDSRCSGTMARYSTYPNPADNELTVAYIKEGKETEGANFMKDFSISLLNEEGKVVRSAANLTENNSVTLDTQLIKNGTYFLHITDNKETIKQQVIISH